MIFKGKITEILTQKENDWCRCYVEDKSAKRLLCVGVIEDASPQMEVELEGEEVDDKWGHQFKIKTVLKKKKDSFSGIRRFLSEFMYGIGEKTANDLTNALGNKLIDAFERKDKALISSVKGVRKTNIDKWFKSYEDNKSYLELYNAVNGGISRKQADKLFGIYGSNAIKTIKKNPYALMDLDGYGFLKTDAIALSVGIRKDDSFRVLSAIKYALSEAESAGNMYLTEEEIKSVIVPLLAPARKIENLSAEVVNNSIENWGREKVKYLESSYKASAEAIEEINDIVETRKNINDKINEVIKMGVESEEFVNADGKIYAQKMFELEDLVAQMLVDMTHLPPVKTVSEATIESAIKQTEEHKNAELKEAGREPNFEITEEQREAIYTALMNRVSIISGGPGRGKTAISEVVARAFMANGGNAEDIIMIAPTGRAAQRITESTGHEAGTIHRKAYKYIKSGDDVKRILMPESECPRKKLILADEMSMADIYLMRAVLNYAQFSNLVLVGDADQIASVGPGKVLRDSIASGAVPYVLLKKGHRNAGSIARNAEKINAGQSIRTYEYDECFRYTPCTTDNIADIMVNDYIRAYNKYRTHKDVMLCTAMKERGVICTKVLNERLQEVFTKGKDELKLPNGRVFRVGDRVMQTKNNYKFEKLAPIPGTKDYEHLLGVFNGEKGTVVKVDKGWDVEYGLYSIVVLFDDGQYGKYTKETIPDLTLAYAITLHKCQGSEAKCMMMGYVYGDYILLNKSLFYTGETRAKKEFLFYGEEKPSKFDSSKMVSAFELAVRNAQDSKRNTSLADMLREKSKKKIRKVV